MVNYDSIAARMDLEKVVQSHAASSQVGEDASETSKWVAGESQGVGIACKQHVDDRTLTATSQSKTRGKRQRKPKALENDDAKAKATANLQAGLTDSMAIIRVDVLEKLRNQRRTIVQEYCSDGLVVEATMQAMIGDLDRQIEEFELKVDNLVSFGESL